MQLYKTVYGLFNAGGEVTSDWVVKDPVFTSQSLIEVMHKMNAISPRSEEYVKRYGELVIREQTWELVTDWSPVADEKVLAK